MSMSIEQPSAPLPSPARQFWRTWRRDIIRGGVLFSLVVGVGVAVSRVHVGLPSSLSRLRDMRGFEIDPDGSLFGADRQIGDQWEWRAPLKAAQQVWIRNTNGPVDVVPGTGEMLEVIAEKSWRNSSPSEVELVAVPSPQGVTICAMWQARDSNCGSQGEYELHDVRRNDVAVRFTVKLPRGVRVDASTVNGQVAVEGATAGIQVSTVNGRVTLHATGGPVKAQTVNGSVEARLDEVSAGGVEIETVNGSVTATVPAQLSAVLDASTVNGRVQTDLPLQLTGKISPRRVHGTLGTGGPSLRLATVNGSINLRVLGATPAPDGVPVPPQAPRRARTTPRP